MPFTPIHFVISKLHFINDEYWYGFMFETNPSSYRYGCATMSDEFVGFYKEKIGIPYICERVIPYGGCVSYEEGIVFNQTVHKH